MKKLTFLLSVLCIFVVSLLYGAYPNEFPIFLGTIGFQKAEITHLQNGGVIRHSLYDKLPGEYGLVAALVQNVPNYFFRDYYQYIENYLSITQFQQIGKFSDIPTLQDIKPLQFTNSELHELLACNTGNCGIKLSSAEIASIPPYEDIKTEEERAAISDFYRTLLLNRILAYKEGGTAALAPYNDTPEPQSPEELLKLHLYKFPYLAGYFPRVEQTILEYPKYQPKGMINLFFWSRDHLGNKPVISIQHVMIFGVGEDFVVVNKLVYSNHYLLSSIGLTHLINYANITIPRTLVVYDRRTLTDLSGNPMKAFRRNILRANLEKKVSDGFETVTKAIEERYISRWYSNFPYGLLPRDQR